jgi:demethylmenaquinone methyltransferase/2-methoxy-6-polyprenyl-1,4-benzoquinol methylase
VYGPGDLRAFDRLARLYDAAMPPARRAPVEAALRLADGPVDLLLDVAGGPGRASARLDVSRTVVVDAAPGMARRARARAREVVLGDAGRLPVADASADAVLIADALHHLPDRDAAVAAARDALRPGGVLVVREFDPGTLRGRALVAAEHAVGFSSRFEGPDDLAGRVARAGLVPTVVGRGFGYTVAGKREVQ